MRFAKYSRFPGGGIQKPEKGEEEGKKIPDNLTVSEEQKPHLVI